MDVQGMLAELELERASLVLRLDDIDGVMVALRRLADSSPERVAAKAEPERKPAKLKPATTADEWGCDRCEFVGKTEHALNIHRGNKHGTKVSRDLRCDDCGKKFANRSNLLRHRRKKHEAKPAVAARASASIPVGARPKPVEFDGPKVGDVELGPMRRTKFDPDAVRSAAAEAM